MKRLLLACVIALWTNHALAAPGMRLFKDINAVPNGTEIIQFKEVGGKIFFLADPPDTGSRLYVLDGSPDGATALREFTTNAARIFEYDGLALVETEGATNSLWLSDGTLPGTQVLEPSSGNYDVMGFLGDKIIVYQVQGTPKRIWAIDRTTQTMIHEFDSATNMRLLNLPRRSLQHSTGLIFLQERDIVSATDERAELMRITPSLTIETLRSQLWIGATSYLLYDLAAIDNKIFYSAPFGTAAETNNELYLYDIDAGSGARVKNINPGSADSNPSNFIVIGDTLYFTAEDGANGEELWKSDGTASGTQMAADIRTGSGGASFANIGSDRRLFAVGDHIYFSALGGDGSSGFEPWVSDGTQAGTMMLKDVWPGNNNSVSRNFAEYQNHLVFTAHRPEEGNDLWISDGTSAGTVPLVEFNAGIDNGPFAPTEIGDRLYLSGFTIEAGAEPGYIEGVDGDFTQVADVTKGTQESDPKLFVRAASQFFFAADDGVHGRELWVSDGTPDGTRLVADIVPGWKGALDATRKLIPLGGEVMFFAQISSDEIGIFISDGTESGTRLLFPAGGPGEPDIFLSSFSDMAPYQGRVAFNAANGSGGGEICSIGRTGDLESVADRTDAGNPMLVFGDLTESGGFLFFTALAPEVSGTWIYRTDGTQAETKPLVAPPSIPFISDMWPWNDRLVVCLAETDFQMYITNELQTTLFSIGPANFPSFGSLGDDYCFFGQSDLQVLDNPDGFPNIVPVDGVGVPMTDSLAGVGVGNRFFFTGAIPDNGNELFRTDDMLLGHLVRDIVPGTDGSDPLSFVPGSNYLYFTAMNDTAGREWWRTDGTESETLFLGDVRPGSDSGARGVNPHQANEEGIVFLHNPYLAANDGINGKELWTYAETGDPRAAVRSHRWGAYE